VERIQDILQRLQELYGARHRKTAIDIDLMLDYTRVMYADLLEWRRNLPSLNDDHIGERSKDDNAVAVIDNAAESNPISLPAPVIAGHPDITTGNPEQQVEELIREEGSGISFEPPHPANHKETVDTVLVEEEPVINEPIENIEIPQPAEPVDIVPHIPATTSTRDIRSGIGINDKYLFLNELFNNHKTGYEEALDTLNRFRSYEEAYSWLVTNIAASNKWIEDDETVQSFFSVLKKHFSASR